MPKNDWLKNKMILLNYNRLINPLVWYGEEKERAINPDEDHEQPLILEINGKNFYFYAGGIKIHHHKSNEFWVNYNSDLKTNDQIKVIEEFTKKSNPDNLYEQNTLTKLKVTFIKNLTSIWNQNSKNNTLTETEEEKISNFDHEFKNLAKAFYFLNKRVNDVLVNNFFNKENNQILDPNKEKNPEYQKMINTLEEEIKNCDQDVNDFYQLAIKLSNEFYHVGKQKLALDEPPLKKAKLVDSKPQQNFAENNPLNAIQTATQTIDSIVNHLNHTNQVLEQQNETITTTDLESKKLALDTILDFEEEIQARANQEMENFNATNQEILSAFSNLINDGVNDLDEFNFDW
ncbi:MAG: hypothetical protein REH79_03635 [Spiroplasma sp.]|nr:hypothetical protein [Spiroplasma sp.]